MLKKLLKYEFKATARTYGGMYLALLAASVLFGGSVRRWNGTNSDTYSTLVGLLSLVYTAVIIGTVVVTIMTIVQRFYRNLLGREGYLMHTLPVTETQLVTSKLISSTVWSLCSILAACLSFGILAVLMMADMDQTVKVCYFSAKRNMPMFAWRMLAEKLFEAFRHDMSTVCDQQVRNHLL